MKKIGIIGFGIMGEAFATGLVRKHPETGVVAFDQKPDRLSAAAHMQGITVARSPAEVFASTDLAIICVKPQDFPAFAESVREASRGASVISIMAGRKIQAVAEALGTDQVARFMPNISATKGASLIGVSFHPQASPRLREDALGVAAALGTGMEIQEKLMSAVTGVSGSGIAYAFQFAHALAQGGVVAGLDYRTALTAAIATLEGAVSLLKDGTHPMELVSRVTSPAGTTIQGIKALEDAGFTAAVMEAVEASARKATEFEG
jgi:pyrroline-5-carboxylate reductase